MTIPRSQVQVTFAQDAEPEPQTLQMHSRGRTFLKGLLLILLVLLAHGLSVRGQFIHTDRQNITENVALRTWGQGMRSIWLRPGATPHYSPLAYTIMRVEKQVLRQRAVAWHAASVLLHAVNVVLLFALLSKLKLPGALFAAAVFAVHPVQLEAVAWVSQQRILLCGGFYLTAMMLFFRVAGITAKEIAGPGELGPPPGPAPQWLIWTAMFLAGAASMLCHPVGATFPLAAATVAWWRKGTIEARDWLTLAPLILLALMVSALVVVSVQRTSAGTALSGIDLILIPLGVLSMHAFRLFWPVGVVVRDQPWTAGMGLFFAAMGLLVLCCAWIWRKRLNRGIVAAAMLFVLGLLAALLGESWRSGLVADHAAYLANAAALSGIAVGMALVMRRIGSNGPAEWIAPSAAAILVLALSAMTVWRLPAYASDEALWSAVLRTNPNSLQAHNALGLLELNQRDAPQRAMGHFLHALALNPHHIPTQLNIAAAHEARRDWDKAIAQYSQVLSLHPRHPQALFGLAVSLDQQGRSSDAVLIYQDLLALDPNHLNARMNIAEIYAGHGDVERAIECYREALRIDPRSTSVYINLANLMFRQGDLQEAERLLLTATRIDPTDYRVFVNVGVMQAEFAQILSDPIERREGLRTAAILLRQAARLKPDDTVVYNNLGKVLAKQAMITDRAHEALDLWNGVVVCFERSLSLDPDQIQIRPLLESARRDRNRIARQIR